MKRQLQPERYRSMAVFRHNHALLPDPAAAVTDYCSDDIKKFLALFLSAR